MAPFDTRRLPHPVARSQAMHSKLAAGLPAVSKASLKRLLAAPYPDGICCQFYSQGMGTWWSLLFDPMQMKIEAYNYPNQPFSRRK